MHPLRAASFVLTPRYLLLGVVLGTLALTSLSSLFFHGEVRHDFLTTGLVASLVVGSLAIWYQQDLTKRVEKALAESLRLNDHVINNVDEGIVVVGMDMRYRLWNAYMERHSGVPAKEVLGKRCDEVFPFLRDQVEPIQRTLEGETVALPDLPYSFPDRGESGWYSSYHMPLRETDGKITGGIGIIRDITERKRAENEVRALNAELERRVAQRTKDLLAAKDEAERANLAKSEFLSRISHELRTPLNAIVGYAQLLELEPLEQNQREEAGEIRRAGEHLLELINELLELSRIEAGQLQVSLEPVGIAGIFHEAAHMVAPLLQPRALTLHRPQSPATAQKVLADPKRLRQILLNLLSNAAKYNNPNGAITLECRLIGVDRLRLSVCDTGPGIPQEHLSRLFLPFDRLGAEKTQVEGTGIGLTICQRMAQLMDSSIEVESALGCGSTFWLDLPLAGEDKERQAAVHAATALPMDDGDSATALCSGLPGGGAR